MNRVHSGHGIWTALWLLTTGFVLSQAFRTVAAIMAPPLQAELGLGPQELGSFASAFFLAFGLLQLPVGLGIDVLGLRRTVLLVSPAAVLGAVVSALAGGFKMLVLGQILIGMGCAPAFLVCTVHIARSFPARRYSAVTGIIMTVGGAGMLLTGTPLAWLIDATSWRTGFWVLGAASALSWLAIALGVREPPQPAGRHSRESVGQAARTLFALLRLPHTAGIVLLALVTYGSFIALRGLWIGPFMTERYGWGLIPTGHLILALTLAGLASTPLVGRLDPGGALRRRWLFWSALASALLFFVLVLNLGLWVNLGAAMLFAAISSVRMLEYPDVKASYGPEVLGRALALMNMALFMGAALMQWLTGAVAAAAQQRGMDPFGPVFATTGVLLLAGALAFRYLPQPPARVGEGD